jgi:hypothetical protein
MDFLHILFLVLPLIIIVAVYPHIYLQINRFRYSYTIDDLRKLQNGLPRHIRLQGYILDKAVHRHFTAAQTAVSASDFFYPVVDKDDCPEIKVVLQHSQPFMFFEFPEIKEKRFLENVYLPVYRRVGKSLRRKFFKQYNLKIADNAVLIKEDKGHLFIIFVAALTILTDIFIFLFFVLKIL